MNSRLTSRFASAEFFGLCALALALPLAETPMHIAFVILFVGSLGRCISSYSWRRPDFFEWLLLAMTLIALASTVVNWPLVKGMTGFRNYVTLYILFWIAYQSDYNIDQMRKFFWLLVAAVMVGLLYGLWELQSGANARLELHSAGIVTQSSIYLGEVFFIMLGGYLDKTFMVTCKSRLILLFCIIFSAGCLLVMGSRGGILGVVVGLFFLGLLIKADRRFFTAVGWVVAIILLVGFVGAMVSHRIPVLSGVTHLTSNIDDHGINFDGVAQSDLVRWENWRIGYSYATHSKHPLLGIGPRNYLAINIEKLPIASSLKTYPNMWHKLHHAHNLFLTKWCEEGVLGLVAFVLFLGRVVWVLLLCRPREHEITWYWVGALGTVNVFVVAGSFNSAFYNEFAWLAMIIMGYAMRKLQHRILSEDGFGL